MKTTSMKWLKRLGFTAISLALAACAQPQLAPSQVQYQVRSNHALLNYAVGVSKGFLASHQQVNGRGGFFGGDPTTSMPGTVSSSPLNVNGIALPPMPTGFSNPPVGGYILQQAITQEVEDCVQTVTNVPKNCGNYYYAVGTLACCLNEIITYRNPVMTYAYRNLDAAGQQYWAYLLNWRQMGTIDTFNPNSFNALSNYATNGYVTQSYP